MLFFLLLFVFTPTDARAYYTNSSSSIAATKTSSEGLAGDIASSSTSNSNASSIPSWDSAGFYNTKSYWVGETTKQYPLQHEVVTARPNGASQIQSLSNVMKCWSSIETWRNESASFQNAKLANRTWSVTSFWSTTQTTFSRSSTIYPTNVSTYTLCDGTPRVNARPRTTHWSGNTTFSGTYTKTLTPTFREQPCSLSPYDCRLLYHDTDAAIKNENELLNQCGNPAHLDEDPRCLLGGGPVELVYFPVESNNNSLCNNRTSGALTARPMMRGLSEITTLGRTFTSDSVYLSFKTLFATYDGFWDRVGPNFTDLIVPLHSTDVSTQCGGWGAAYGAGTALNYADLNWPVPASAYSCQDRCSLSYISSASLFPPLNIIGWQLQTVSPPEQCSTIWSDVNPVLAVPTKIRQMVPEWSTCSFWDKNIANFWFDPPIALQPAEAMAVPTAPLSPQSTPAAAASTPTSPAAPNTQIASSSTFSVSTPTPADQADPSSANDAPAGPTVTDGVDTGSSLEDPEASSTQDNDPDVSYDPSPSHIQGSPSLLSTSAGSPISIPPALSVLTEALSTYQSSLSVDPSHTSANTNDGLLTGQSSVADSATIGDIVASVIGLTSKTQPSAESTSSSETPETSPQVFESSQNVEDIPTASQPAYSYDPVATHSAEITKEPYDTGQSAVTGNSDQTLAPGDLTITISKQSSAVQTVTIDSHAITDWALTTIFGHTVTRGGGGTAILTELTTGISVTRQSLLVAGSVTVTASAVPSQTDAIIIGGILLSMGGPAATISGNTITQASGGLLLVGSDVTATFTSPLSPLPSDGQSVWALGSVTLTVSSDPLYVNGFLSNGTSLSYGTGTVVVDGATITAGWGALQISGSDMAEISSTTTEGQATITASSGSVPPVILTDTTSPSMPTRESTTTSTTISMATCSRKNLALHIATYMSLIWSAIAISSAVT